MNNKTLLFAKFLEKEILLNNGRHLFSLLNSFASEGYQIRCFNNLSSNTLGKYARQILSLDNLVLTDIPPSNTEDWIYLYDREDKAVGNSLWRKKIQIRYDIFSPYWFKNPILMPFPIHPIHVTPDLQQRLLEYRSIKKNMRIYFSGESKGYIKNHIQYPETKLTRLEIIKSIQERMHDDVLIINNQTILNSLDNATYNNKCVLVDTNKIWVDHKVWLGNLARADFFLSPPGFVMPMCHNIIEALAIGSIPITNYAEWFNPPLSHMVNCIVFNDRDDLINKLKHALEMDEEQIATMRANALNYYETYLKPDTFVRKIESSRDRTITLLMITSNNMARNASKLNKYSILMRGTISSNEKNWLNRLSQYVFMRH